MNKNPKSRRFILLLDSRYQEEQELLDIIKSTPNREGRPFLRELMLIGFQAMKAKELTDTAQVEEGRLQP